MKSRRRILDPLRTFVFSLSRTGLHGNRSEAVAGIDGDLTLLDSGLANDTAVFDILLAEIIAEIGATSFALVSDACIAAVNQPASWATASFGVFAGANNQSRTSAS
jgi:hypothetical protein